MNRLKKTISFVLIAATLASNVFFIFPGIGNAQVDTSVPVNDKASNSVNCGVNFFGVCVPFTSLDSFAWFAAKVMIRQLTTDVVNWINSGFDGNPAFVTNPAGFFTNIVDEQIGLMIEQSSDLNFLCSPFSIDIRLALAFKYRPFQKKITCTLSDVIRNSQNAVTGASINGFTAGDFQQGGWPAFISMTTEPQNNVYGAYMEAENELSIRIGNKQLLKRDELGAGRGFLSWEKCTDVADDFVGPSAGERERDITGNSYNETVANANKTGRRNCEVQTPGSVIESQLETSLGTGIRQLELADSFNEITNALVAQLINQVLQKGLGAVSGGGARDPESYINQIENDRTEQNQQLQSIKERVIPEIDRLLQTENAYKSLKTATVNQILQTRQTLDFARTCFVEKYDHVSRSKRVKVERALEDIDETLSEQINPLAGPLLADLDRVNQNITTLEGAKRELNSAVTLNDTYYPTQDITSLTESGQLHTDEDRTAATTEREEVSTKMNVLNNWADNRLRECQLL